MTEIVIVSLHSGPVHANHWAGPTISILKNTEWFDLLTRCVYFGEAFSVTSVLE